MCLTSSFSLVSIKMIKIRLEANFAKWKLDVQEPMSSLFLVINNKWQFVLRWKCKLQDINCLCDKEAVSWWNIWLLWCRRFSLWKSSGPNETMQQYFITNLNLCGYLSIMIIIWPPHWRTTLASIFFHFLNLSCPNYRCKRFNAEVMFCGHQGLYRCNAFC